MFQLDLDLGNENKVLFTTNINAIDGELDIRQRNYMNTKEDLQEICDELPVFLHKDDSFVKISAK